MLPPFADTGNNFEKQDNPPIGMPPFQPPTTSGGPLGIFGSPALQTIEGLLKMAALFLAVITLLGTPAVAVQYGRLHIPFNFMTRDQALRAGALPTVLLTVLIFSLQWMLRNPSTVRGVLSKQQWGGPYAELLGVSGVALTDSTRWLTITTALFTASLPIAILGVYLTTLIPQNLAQAHNISEPFRRLLPIVVGFPILLLLDRVLRRLVRAINERISLGTPPAEKIHVQAKIFSAIRTFQRFVRASITRFSNNVNRMRHPLIVGAFFALIISGEFILYSIFLSLLPGLHQRATQTCGLSFCKAFASDPSLRLSRC